MKNFINSSPKFAERLSNILRDEKFLKNEIFRIPAIRDAITMDRYTNLFNSHIAESHSDASAKVTIAHNTDIDRMFFAGLSRRPDLISNVLTSVNSVRLNASKMKVLSIGSRTEAELFSLINAGFFIDNIECIDLFSYSPLVKVGDVHDLKYASNSFDVIVCGWVLEFCNDIEKACREIQRVTKPGGLICIGGMHHPISTNMEEYNKHKQHEDRVWYCNIKTIKQIFKISDESVVFKSDIEPMDLDKRGEVIIVFRKDN